MHIDVRTLILALSMVFITMGLTMMLYGRFEKSHPGFFMRGLTMILAAIGILAFGLRGPIPDTLSIVISNTFLIFAFLMHLDSFCRFFLKQKLPLSAYTAVPLTLALIFIFTFFIDDVAVRLFIYGTYSSIVLYLIAYLIIFRTDPKERSITWGIAVVYALLGTAMLVRGVVSLLKDIQDPLMSNLLLSTIFIIAIPFEIFVGLSFFHLNHRRAEWELEKAKNRLNEQDEKLNIALSEVKTLNGLLPICAECRKARNDEGYWDKLENYLVRHANARLTHGLCPECARKYIEEMNKNRETNNRQHHL